MARGRGGTTLVSPVQPVPPLTETQALKTGQAFYPSFTCEEARPYKIKIICPRTSGMAPKWQSQDSNVTSSACLAAERPEPGLRVGWASSVSTPYYLLQQQAQNHPAPLRPSPCKRCISAEVRIPSWCKHLATASHPEVLCKYPLTD